MDRLRALMIGRIATSFPGDRSAELNLVPVDRVASGMLASLTAPEAIGARIHLATDNRIRSEDICRIAEEELGVKVRMTDPTLSRNVTLPLYKALLLAVGDHKLANVVEKLGTIFGVYGEWGQPIHDVGNDVRLLGLPIRRPETAKSFRMLCRHNKYVQEFAKVRDARRDRAPRAGLGRGDRGDRVRDRPRGGGDPGAGVPAAVRGPGRARVVQAALNGPLARRGLRAYPRTAAPRRRAAERSSR